MKTLKLSFLVLSIAICGSLHCGGTSDTPKDGAPGVLLGTGGAGTGGALGWYDAALAPDSGSSGELGNAPTADVAMGDEVGTRGDEEPPINCQGKTEAQCHESIINPAAVPTSIQQQDPGANPAVPYPSCAAL